MGLLFTSFSFFVIGERNFFNDKETTSTHRNLINSDIKTEKKIDQRSDHRITINAK